MNTITLLVSSNNEELLVNQINSKKQIHRSPIGMNEFRDSSFTLIFLINEKKNNASQYHNNKNEKKGQHPEKKRHKDKHKRKMK